LKYVMRQTIETLRKENGEMKLPQEISQQLYELLVMEEKEMRLKDSVLLTLQSQVLQQYIYLLESMINFSARQ
jgi:flagellar basal body-associated protein FliL